MAALLIRGCIPGVGRDTFAFREGTERGGKKDANVYAPLGSDIDAPAVKIYRALLIYEGNRDGRLVFRDSSSLVRDDVMRC